MKNIFRILMLPLIALFVVSCEKDDIGGTATESMAGEWVITSVEIYDTDGNFYEDYSEYDCAYTINTFNTADNIATEMWITDAYSYWYMYVEDIYPGEDDYGYGFQAKVDIDQSTKTFSAVDSASTMYQDDYYEEDDVDEEYPIAYYYDTTVTITNGAITTDGATSPTGMPTDSISFEAEFGDELGYIYKFSGYRYSGFE